MDIFICVITIGLIFFVGGLLVDNGIDTVFVPIKIYEGQKLAPFIAVVAGLLNLLIYGLLGWILAGILFMLPGLLLQSVSGWDSFIAMPLGVILSIVVIIFIVNRNSK